MIKAYTERENDYKQSLPEDLYQKIKDKREDEDDSGSKFDEVLDNM
jgi:hypothetical protein